MGMTGYEMQQEIKRKRREAFYQQRAWWWNGANGTVRIGVLQGIGQKNWIVGHLTDSGSRKKLNSAHLSKYHPSTDPDRLLEVVAEWARKRQLEEVVD